MSSWKNSNKKKLLMKNLLIGLKYSIFEFPFKNV